MDDPRRDSYGGPFDGNPSAGNQPDYDAGPDGECGGFLEIVIEVIGGILSIFG